MMAATCFTGRRAFRRHVAKSMTAPAAGAQIRLLLSCPVASPAGSRAGVAQQCHRLTIRGASGALPAARDGQSPIFVTALPRSGLFSRS